MIYTRILEIVILVYDVYLIVYDFVYIGQDEVKVSVEGSYIPYHVAVYSVHIYVCIW